MTLSIQENVPLAPFTSFKAGGPAKYFCEPNNQEEMIEALKWSKENTQLFFVLGKGTNLVFSDKGFDGLIIYTVSNFNNINWEGYKVSCDAGALVYSLVVQSVKKNFKGIQKLGGVPGTLGGAAYMNAGAYGQEFCDTITQVRSVDLQGNIYRRTNEECKFSYRHSHFWDVKELIIGVELEFEDGDSEQTKNEMRESLSHRKETQPLNLPNSGSVFKRPPGMFPGKLVEEAGLKGFRKGDAEVSPKHGNFIINHGKASAQDLFDLSEEVKQKVKAQLGVGLEREVFLVGDFLPWPR